MKRCPTCSRVYDDVGLRFCLDDGTELVNKPSETPAPQTLAMPAATEPQPTVGAFQPPPPPPPPAHVSAFQSRRQRNLIIWIVILGLGLPFIAGLVYGMWTVNKRKLAWHLVLEVDPKAPDRSAAVRQTVNVIDGRLDGLGLANYEVRPEGDPANGRIVVNLPAIDDPERVKQIITTWGKLELVEVISPPSPAPVQTFMTREEAAASFTSNGDAEPTHRVLPYADREEVNTSAAKRWVVVKSPAIVTGSDLRDAAAVNRTGRGDDYQITFTLKASGADKFGTWTGANINNYLGVVLNDEVKSIAYIKSQIFDQGEITGRFSKQSAEDLALVLRAGALPVPVKLVEERMNK